MVDLQDSLNLYCPEVRYHRVFRDDVLNIFESNLKDECLRTYGGFEKIVSKLLSSESVKLCWYISKRTSPNAAAGLIPNSRIGIIRINAGLILRSKNLFLDLTCDDNSRWVGERLDRLSRLFEGDFKGLLFDLAMIFSFYHELAHINQKLNNKLYEKLSSTKPHNLTDREKRILNYLEYDADIYASLTVTDHLIHNYFDRINYSLITEELMGDSIALLCLPIYISMSQFRDFDQGIYQFGDSHPHPRMRLLVSTYHSISQCVDYVMVKNINFEIDPLPVFKSMIELSKVLYHDNLTLMDSLLKEIDSTESFDIENFLNDILRIVNNNKDFATSMRHELALSQRSSHN
ncbi:hypothetical protein GGR28_003774 [Lewinella aquimaris]|uniref:Uncharacterized protein n=1 Tax=Neolewinella aquimaris TaxID=1835722 RepID=A0A840ECC5_9BACT|nr:hypothetical protein [Neolewinella aquimaris]MBB4081127.1 hypothetical protein [Neolewinella aquimaris]